MPKVPNNETPEATNGQARGSGKAQSKPPVPPSRTAKKVGTVAPPAERPVIYPTIEVDIYHPKDGHGRGMTADEMKELLGWRELVEGDNSPHLLVDHYQRRIVCDNNTKNRPLYPTTADVYRQEVLRKNFQFNGETIIIGETGSTLSGQHRGLGFILACQEWHTCQDWQAVWPEEPVLYCTIIKGISETDEVVNTIDTGKPRTLADALFHDAILADLTMKDRRVIARAVDHAVRLLWDRTGAKFDAFAHHRTHSEAKNFINQHRRIIKAVRHVYEEDANAGRITKYITLGYGGAMMYLMGCSGSDPEIYRKAQREGTANEDLLEWSFWDRAMDFWTLLAQGSTIFESYRKVWEEMAGEGKVNPAERRAILAKAWEAFYNLKEGEPIPLKAMKIKYDTNEEGLRMMAESPTVGGIDYGDNPSEPDEEHVRQADPSPEELEARKAAEEERRLSKDKEAKAARKAEAEAAQAARTNKKGNLVGTSYPKGTIVWVVEEGKEPWAGRLVGVKGKIAQLQVEQGHQGAGSMKVAPLAACQPKQPRPLTKN